METKKKLSQELPWGSENSSAGTHLKSPSSFSCCTSLNTIGLINTLLIIVPMMKYPKMLTGPSQPVLQRRKRSQLIIQAKGHSCTIRLKQSKPSAVSSLAFHRNMGRSFCISQYSQDRVLWRVETTHPCVKISIWGVVTWLAGSKERTQKRGVQAEPGYILTCESTGMCSRPV